MRAASLPVVDRGRFGWRAAEIAALPVAIFDEYARLFDAIERGGEWPEGLTHAPVPLLPT